MRCRRERSTSPGYLYQYGRFSNLTPYDAVVHERARALLIDTLRVHEPGRWGSAGALLGLARLVRYSL